MAEGLVNHDFKEDIEAFSAGIIPTPINRYTIEVMEEIGIDISNQYPKHVETFVNDEFDLVIILCDYASQQCPEWSCKGEKVHIPIEDPFGTVGRDDAEVLKVYREAREKIGNKIGSFLKEFLKKHKSC